MKYILKIENWKLKIAAKQDGQMLVELVMAIGIAAIILPALLTGLVTSRAGRPQQQQTLQASNLFKETVNAVEQVRNNNWASFAVDGTYHPVISSNQWTFASGATTSASFTQRVDISDVYRDSTTNAIVTTGGTLDPSTKKVVITISWTQPYASSVTGTLYLSRLTNLTSTETTKTDFNKGTINGTSVVATAPSGTPDDGQVQLGAGGGGGDWCSPQNATLKTYDLPGQGVVQSISATSSATRYAYAYTTTGGNASGDAVDGVTVDNNANPPAVTTPSNNNEAKAYGIFVDQNNNYVYFNENNPPNHTVRIASASNLANVGYFDVSGTGSSIYVQGNVGYVTVGSKLYSFDVSTIKGSSSQTQLGSVNLNGTGNKVVVVGTNAYVATSNTTNQLEVIPVNNGVFGTVKNISLGNGQPAVDLSVNGSQTYAYIVTSFSSGKNDFFIVSLPSGSPIYGYQTQSSMSPNALEIVTGNRAILVGTGGTLYQVFNISNPASASYCGGMSPAGATTVSAVAPIFQGGYAYSYILTNNTTAEFQIILGGAGGQYSSSGTFTSQTYDAGNSVAYNRFVADVAQPAATTLTAQVGVAAPVSGSCTGVSNFTYVGPGGTSASTDTYNVSSGKITGLIPLQSVSPYYVNPQRCFRYKFSFSSTDQTQSPELYDLIVNYSL
jgi:hypothetical protein